MTITESVIESADSGIELANSTADSAANRPVGMGLQCVSSTSTYMSL